MSSSDDSRFDSWKEIAAYLARDMRTVRRWEKEKGLPVHRVPGGSRRAVYAYRGEVDAWLSEVSNESGQPSDIDGTFSPETLSESGAPCKPTRLGQTLQRRRLGRTAGAIVTLAVASVVAALWLHKAGRDSLASAEPLEITSVSPIGPQPKQPITIHGTGFGLHTPFRNTDCPYIAVRDQTRHWSAGRLIPQNWDEVTVDVAVWNDTEIVISGFSGAYGAGDWKLVPGDHIEVAVWNPQSGCGPALYELSVSGQDPR